jgi:hypothetical protein
MSRHEGHTCIASLRASWESMLSKFGLCLQSQDCCGIAKRRSIEPEGGAGDHVLPDLAIHQNINEAKRRAEQDHPRLRSSGEKFLVLV